MGQRLFAAVELFEGLVQGLQIADLGRAAAVALLQPEHLEHEEHQHQRHAAEDEDHLHEALLYRLVEIVVVHHGADDPEAAPHVQMTKGAYLMHPGQIRVGPPVGVVVQRAGFLFLLSAQQLTQTAHVQFLPLIDALAALHDLDAPLNGFGVHDHKVIVILYHDVAVPADMDLRDELLIHDRGVYHEAGCLTPGLLLHHKIVLVTAVVLPVGDVLRPGDGDIADGAEAVAAVDDLAVAVFQPDVPDGIAPGHRGAERFAGLRFSGDGVQPVGVFFQQDADAVGGALHHQLHLPRLAVHHGGAVILPDGTHHDSQCGYRDDADGQRHPQGAQRLEAYLFRGVLLHIESSFGAVLLFLSKNVIILFIASETNFPVRKVQGVIMSYHVLIVDDDPAICKLLSKVMISNEMDPLVVNSGAAALDLIARQSSTLDMILMDITLGDMEGFDVIQTIRRNGVTTPVIIISGRNEDYDFMYGLSLGADDYVTKPFRPQILGAKVKALIRRSKSFSQENNQQISCGPFLCDTTTMRFYKNNVELNLSEKERSLLLLFVRHPQQVFTKDMIYEQIWGNLIAVDDNAIMVYINRLRSKIEDNARTPQHIITIRGVGYRFVP